ncbi:MAG: hypothetical protein AAGI07_18745 [Bacteroidota bacterium]
MSSKSMEKFWSIKNGEIALTAQLCFCCAFIWLIAGGILGVCLRSFFIFNWELPYLNWRHAHSHIMFLGWGFTGIVSLLFLFMNQANVLQKKTLNISFWVMQTAILGMLYAFPRQGYSTMSITYSTIHLVGMGVFLVVWWRIIDRSLLEKQVFLSLAWALFFLILSSIAPIALVIIKVKGLAGSPIYHLAVEWYLHFHYNGWFIFALLALYLNRFKPGFGNAHVTKTIFSLALGCILSFGTNTGEKLNTDLGFGLGILGNILQWYGMILLVNQTYKLTIITKNYLSRLLFGLFTFSIVIKFILQGIASIPPIARFAISSTSLTIGYLHLIFLGGLTSFLMASAIENGWLKVFKHHQTILFAIWALGICGMVVILFAQAFLSIPNIQWWLLGFSTIIVLIVAYLGISTIFINAKSKLTTYNLVQ